VADPFVNKLALSFVVGRTFATDFVKSMTVSGYCVYFFVHKKLS